MVQKYSEKTTSPKKQKKEETGTKKDADSGNEIKQNKRNTREDKTTSTCRIQVRATCV